MKRSAIALVILLSTALVSNLSAAKAKDKGSDPNAVVPSMYVDLAPGDAADRLLAVASRLAADSSRHQLELARIYFLGGRPELGQQILDALPADEADAIDS